MKLEKQVVNLELSKKIDALKVRYESHFMWVKYSLWKEPKVWESDMASEIKVLCLSGKREYEYPAYTVAELGEMLRNDGIDNGFGNIIQDSAQNGHRIWIADTEADEFPWTFDEESTFIEMNEANSRAKMLIYLIENKLIKK